MSRRQRKQMIEPELREPSISRQCQLLSLSRSSFYYAPVPVSAEDLELMRLIDEQYLETPTFGSRSMVRHFWRQGRKVNRKRIQRLMRIMGIEAVYPKPHTSRPHPQHRIYPYLLRNLTIDHANQVWAADITYVSMARGFMYLVAVMDWHSRKILSWRVSNTLDSDFCNQASRRRWNSTASLRSSTRIKEPSLPATGLPKFSRTTKSPSAWTVAADARTTSSLNGCGGPSNTITFTCIPSAVAPSCATAWRNGCAFTTTSADIRLLTTEPRMRFITVCLTRSQRLPDASQKNKQPIQSLSHPSGCPNNGVHRR
jgi:hypothetical protein